ncbi:MAG: transcription elongation factor GreB [Pseudomonadales bacterium]
MSRYRPPAPRAAPYITAAGFARLESELRVLWRETRPEVTRRVAEAAAMGDRSENAEYIYGKKQLREIDARVRYLSKRLEILTVVDRAPTDRSRVFFGAWVDVIDDSGHVERYRLVGPDEIGTAPGYISIDAPVARALLGKRVGDVVTVEVGGVVRELELCGIGYQSATDSGGTTV